MRAVRTSILVLAAAAAAAGCAPRPLLDPRPGMEVTAELEKADALVRAGCYACLTDALTIYERAAATGLAPVAERRAIDTLLLLALRERELGLDGGNALQRAVGLASRQPPPVDIDVFLSVAEAQPWHPGGVSKERQESLLPSLRTLFKSWPAWRARLAPGAERDLLRAYYLLALDCTRRSYQGDGDVPPWQPPASAPPLVRYRAAACPLALDQQALEQVVASAPPFADARLFLGELALGKLTLRSAEKQLAEAVRAMPELPPAWLLLGHVHLAIEELDLARDAYHRVNAAVPGQRDAMLGEAKSLSYLGRHEAAIAILDEVERLGTWYMGEMYYWRAWNRHRLKEHDAANNDVLASRQRMPMDPKVDALAGFIALARNEVERAEGEFRLAVQHYEGRGERDCDSGYYLASTLVMQRKWAEAAPLFERAEPCYALDEQALRQRIATIRGSDLPDDRQDKLVAAKEKDILKVRLQQARSCFNAAVALANLGDLEKARPFAERALAHPDLAAQARALLDRIGTSAPAPGP
jgi:tetratricopeptide (TPR) repeat protein